MTESFGMQLDDDSLLALFSRVMTHPPATVTCYEVLPVYTASVHLVVHVTCYLLHAASVYWLAWPCIAAIDSNQNHCWSCQVVFPSYGGVPSKLVSFIVIRHPLSCVQQQPTNCCGD